MKVGMTSQCESKWEIPNKLPTTLPSEKYVLKVKSLRATLISKLPLNSVLVSRLSRIM